MFYESESNIMVAHFGRGDIMVAPGYMDGAPNIGTISLIDNCGKCMPINEPIMSDEEWARTKAEKGIKTDEDMNTVIRLVFEKPESIDTLIWGLQEVKNRMVIKTS